MTQSPETMNLPELTIERGFDAPRALVFKAWTDAQHVARWLGPRGFTNPLCEIDARPGGALLIHMADPDGNIMRIHGVFLEVDEPSWLSFTTVILDDDGNSLIEDQRDVRFEEAGGKTRMTLYTRITKAPPEMLPIEGMDEGWNETLDRLDELLAGLTG